MHEGDWCPTAERTVTKNGAAILFAIAWACASACGGVVRTEDGREAIGGSTTATGGVPSRGGRTSSGGAPSQGGFVSPGGTVGVGGFTAGGTIGSGGVLTGGANAGNGSSPPLFAPDFDQSCTYDSDCSPVFEGPQCGCHPCANSAIANDALPAWTKQASAIECGPIPGCMPVDCGRPLLATCHRFYSKQTCGIRFERDIDGSKYDTSCTRDADCKLIPLGEVCSSCQCDYGAVSLTGLTQYQLDLENADCSPPPSACDCAAPNGAICQFPATSGDGGPEVGKCVLEPPR